MLANRAEETGRGAKNGGGQIAGMRGADHILDFRAGEEHLSASDPVMRRLIRRVGPCGLKPRTRRPPFESLARAIAYQQLNGTAAETIVRRFIKLFPGLRFPRPHHLETVTDELIRGAGFSFAKVAALRDLAAKTAAGIVPSPREIRSMSDEEIIERLVQVRGVGRWTAEMLLIFQLGRPDVLAVDDFGLRKGYAVAYKLKDLPKPKELLVRGERWRPWRTVASWYLWRAAEMK